MPPSAPSSSQRRRSRPPARNVRGGALRVYERQAVGEIVRDDAAGASTGLRKSQELQPAIAAACSGVGLKLAQIAELVRGKTVPLARLLALQEEELLKRRRQTDRALALVRKARTRIADGKALPLLTYFIALILKGEPNARFYSSPAFNALWRKHLPN